MIDGCKYVFSPSIRASMPAVMWNPCTLVDIVAGMDYLGVLQDYDPNVAFADFLWWI